MIKRIINYYYLKQDIRRRNKSVRKAMRILEYRNPLDPNCDVSNIWILANEIYFFTYMRLSNKDMDDATYKDKNNNENKDD